MREEERKRKRSKPARASCPDGMIDPYLLMLSHRWRTDQSDSAGNLVGMFEPQRHREHREEKTEEK
jgi:hypothetical protein